jgi:hypothetical protein
VLSAEHDIIYVNQVEECSLADWETWTTRTTGRAGHLPWNQTIGDANPASPTHWIISRRRKGTLTYFESRHKDNPELYDPETGEITEGGKRRIGALARLTGSRKKRLYHGLWAPPEGAIYEVFDEDCHKVKSFVPPAHWPRIVGIDPLGAYVAAVWLAWDPGAGVLNVYREYCEPFGITTAGHVDNMLKLSLNEGIFAWIGGAKSERQVRADFQGAGIPLLEPPFADVWVGIDRVNDLLSTFGLVVHDCCEGLLSELGDYRRKMDKQGRPMETIEGKGTYHLLDGLRYACAWLTEPGEQSQVIYAPVKIGREW